VGPGGAGTFTVYSSSMGNGTSSRASYLSNIPLGAVVHVEGKLGNIELAANLSSNNSHLMQAD
jgi:hypothetical protein